MVVRRKKRFQTLILLFQENRSSLRANFLSWDTQGGENIAEKQDEEDDRQDIDLTFVGTGQMS